MTVRLGSRIPWSQEDVRDARRFWALPLSGQPLDLDAVALDLQDPVRDVGLSPELYRARVVHAELNDLAEPTPRPAGPLPA